MPDKIIITEGSWWILLCIIAGLLYAAVLYLYERRFEFSSSRRYLMATIRTVAVSLIAFFLLSPFFRHSTSTVSKPIVIMAQENSASVLAGKDSSFYKRQYPELLNQLVSSLERNFEVHRYSFGQMVSPDITFTFDEKQTNISKLISDLHSLYINRNVGAVILASDGIYNQGVHPYYAVQQMPYPFFTVAMGDTTPQRDALIVRVLHNRIAYLGNSFPVEIQIRGSLCNGLKSRLQVLHKGAALFAENISFEGDKYDKIIQVELKASEPGLHRYTVSLQPIVGEITTTNNVKDFFVDVFEGKQKVLMLYSAPHPDIAAIRQSLDSHQNYEITVSEISHFKENPALYNLVILHQLPSARSADGQLLQQMRDQNIPLLFIIGIGTSVDIFNTLQTGLTITGGGIKLNEALPAMNPAFGLFSLSQEFRDLSRYLPPLFSPFGAYRTTGAASVIFQQQIGSVVTDMPLMLTIDISGQKTGIIAGEGMWRWRLTNYARNNNHRAFDELLGKFVQYLSLREEKSRFRVSTRNTWNENESVEFAAEFYNASYEPVNENEVELTITDEEGRNFPFAFSPLGNSYFLNAGQLYPGNYIFGARTISQQEGYNAKGAFTVLPLQAELISTVADHNLLFGLAQRSGGQMVSPADMLGISQQLAEREDIKPLIYREMKYHELIDIGWLLALIIALLTGEWVLRRIAGGY